MYVVNWLPYIYKYNKPWFSSAITKEQNAFLADLSEFEVC